MEINREELAKLRAFIDAHEEEMVEDIKKLCRIESVSGTPEKGAPFGKGPLEALNSAEQLAWDFRFAVRDYAHKVGTADLNPQAEPALDILAHVDVVPGGEGWTETSPFEPVVKDGVMYGRGVADDKGGVVACLYAMRAVKELGIPVSKRCRLIFGSDEETGSSDVEYYYSVEKPAVMTISPDAQYPIFNGEKGRVAPCFDAEFAPSAGKKKLLSIVGGTAANQIPGVAAAEVEGVSLTEAEDPAAATTEETGVSFDLKQEGNKLHIAAAGKCAHASMPELGKNALQALIKLILRLPLDPCEGLALLKRYDAAYPCGEFDGSSSGMLAEDEVFGKTTCAADILQMTPTSFHAQVDYRLPMAMDDKDVHGILEKTAEKIGAKITVTGLTKAHYVPEDSPSLQMLKNCYEEVTGSKAKCLTMGGGTYVHNVEGGVAFGYVEDEEGAMIHGPNENISVESLKKTVVLFACVIAKLCE